MHLPSERSAGTRLLACGLLLAGGFLVGTRAIAWHAGSYGHHLRAAHLKRQVPDSVRSDGYAPSETCRPCHPDQYDSWRATYHRTMTQVAGPLSVKGDFDGVDLVLGRSEYRLERDEDGFWIRSGRKGATRADRRDRVVMTTGSHHYQVYWHAAGADGKLSSFPFVYLLEADRWVSRQEAFLTPPREGPQVSSWATNCVACHSTHGSLREDGARTVVTELGISCGACHGPSERHLRVNRNPARRYRGHLRGGRDTTIVNPEDLPADRSSQICGQCHSVFMHMKGVDSRYRAGEDLALFRAVIRPGEPSFAGHLERLLSARPNYLRNRFWPDGMVRVAGREYNGLIASKCFRGGELSCLSCHSMHESDPNDQLAAGMEGDEACLPCHASYRNRIREHTHHPEESEGSRCYNCHMPYTSYGLLKAIRSHLIDSPTVAASVRTGRPNACNQCHVDRSLGWTRRALAEWYGTAPTALSGEEETVSATLLWLLRGDAGQRALAAWTLGWEPAVRASGSTWQAPFLAEVLDDPYPAVRYIAARSLARLSALEAFEYDFAGTPGHRRLARDRVLEIWAETGGKGIGAPRSELLLDEDGLVDRITVSRLLRERDDRPITLQE